MGGRPKLSSCIPLISVTGVHVIIWPGPLQWTGGASQVPTTEVNFEETWEKNSMAGWKISIFNRRYNGDTSSIGCFFHSHVTFPVCYSYTVICLEIVDHLAN